MVDPVPNPPEKKDPSGPGLIARHRVGLTGIAGVLGAGLIALFVTSSGPDEDEQAAQPVNGRSADSEILFTPTGAPGPGSRSTPARQTLNSADFIVKFEDEPALESAIKLYRRDQDAGRAAYEAWQAEHPELKDFEFLGGAYSGEVMLRRHFDGPPTRAAVAGVLEELRNRPDVAYCDPDYSAHPGRGD